MEALAVAIRTFAVANAGRHARDGFDLCDGTHCQVPRAATPATRHAARATARSVLVYEGAPAEVFYSASCGGHSEDPIHVWPGAKLPYLRSIVDDVHADDVPWTLDRTLREIQQALVSSGFAGSRLTGLLVEARSESGRVTRLGLTGLRPATITGEAFRTVMGQRAVRSTAFSVDRRGTTIRFTGRGYGHGVGMCVVGAGRRARRGETVEQILAAYYPGLELRDLDALVKGPAEPVVVSVADTPGRGASAVVAPRAVSVVVPASAPAYARNLQERATRAQEALSVVLGVAPSPVVVELYDTIESFRVATGRPWWTAFDAGSQAVALGPTSLTDSATLDATLAAAIAEHLMAPALAGRPQWVRVGGGRHLARTLAARASGSSAEPMPRAAVDDGRRRDVCPSDAELTLAVSAAAQREAERRAEACFSRSLTEVGDWRNVGRR
jgi:stage II sporulation protein D